MSSCTPSRALSSRFRLVLASFLSRSGLPFAAAITEASIHKAFDEEGVSFAEEEDAVYTPSITLWAFLSQTLCTVSSPF